LYKFSKFINFCLTFYLQTILYKMMWGKIERQAAFSEEAYGSGTPLNMRILYRKKGIRKIAQKEKIL
ncbi:hypothetical protein NE595_13955, partial [Coprococcus sp. DFI.6.81]